MMQVRRIASLVVAWLSFLTASFSGTAALSEDGIETILFIRHGEKPESGLGQLNCQGLNRALALPSVMANSFGSPDAIFVPNPSIPKEDAGKPYDYVRPLATVEPTAILFGLPIDASIGVSDIEGLKAALERPLSLHRNTLILVAWEHKEIVAIAKELLAAHGGDPAVVPKWHGDDFDSIYIVSLSVADDPTKTSFAREHENLDGQPETCPR
jgi:hypothetical protein